MEKKYIIAVVAVVVLWAAFMGYRHFNKKEESRTHREDTYNRMTEMAKKSPRAGLYEMAEAIRRYHADLKAYPPNLNALYPKYIPSQAFIQQIDWSYAPAEGDFFLSKSGTYDNKTMVASIDSRMKPEVEIGGVMVASRRAAPKKPLSVEIEEEAPIPVQEAISETMVLEVMAEREMTVKEADVVTAAVSPELRRGDHPQAAEEKVNVQTELSRIITLVGDEAVSAREAEIGYNLERYLVWKNPNGAIGVSNVEFPDRTDMYVAVKNRWYNVRRRRPERGGAQATEITTAHPEEQQSTEQIAAAFSRDFLVWKGAGGAIGIGDSQYPDKTPLLIASQGGRNEWSELERPPLSIAASAAEEKAGDSGQQHIRDINSIAADISSEYLVWRNTDGSIGIGDSQYPERRRLEVASRGEWSVLTKEPLPERTQRESSTAAPKAEEKPDENLLAAGVAGQYLMWKDKNGQVGFGNVAYPEFRNIAYIHSGGSWQKVLN